MVFVLAVTLLVGVAVGVIPVVHAMRSDASSVFRGEGTAGTSSRGTRAFRRALAVAQVGLALVLLISAVLLLASFRRVLDIDPEFAPSNVLTGSIALPSARNPGDSEPRAFVESALDKIRSLPGVRSAGATNSLPFGGRYSDSVILAEDYVMKAGESMVSPNNSAVTPGYFEAMGIPLIFFGS